MTPEQREELKEAAQAAEKDGSHIYTDPRDSNKWEENRTWHEVAKPAAILSLIAQVEAPTVQQDVIRAAQGDAILGFVQAMIDAGLADSGLMAVAKKIAHVIVISPPVPAIPGTKEGA